MKATALLRHNIETLLRARGHDQKDLAQWCHRTEAWLSKILEDEEARKRKGTKERGLPVRYFDRIADFFGIEPYQLLQPGVSRLSERRSGLERRGRQDRRIGRGGLMRETTPVSSQVALVELVGYLNEREQADFVRMIGERLRGRLPPPAEGRVLAGQESDGGTRGPTGRVKGRKARNKAGKVGASSRDASEE